MSHARLRLFGREFVTVEELAEKLSYTPAWVRELIREEKIPAMRRGRRWWVEEPKALQALGIGAHANTDTDELAGL